MYFLYKIPILSFFVNLLAYIWLPVSVFLSALFMTLMRLLGLYSRDVESFFPRNWNRSLLFFFGIRVEVEGKEHYPKDSPLIIVSNHESFFDIPAIYEVFHGHLRMVAKAELFKIPLFGYCLRGAGLIPIERGNVKSAIEARAAIGNKVKEGYQIWLAPEGKRSEGNELLEFKKGAFQISFENKIPLLAVVLEGTCEILSKKSLWVRGGSSVKVRILPLFDSSQYSDAEAYLKEVRQKMLELHKKDA